VVVVEDGAAGVPSSGGAGADCVPPDEVLVRLELNCFDWLNPGLWCLGGGLVLIVGVGFMGWWVDVGRGLV